MLDLSSLVIVMWVLMVVLAITTCLFVYQAYKVLKNLSKDES